MGRLKIRRKCSGELIPASRPEHMLRMREIRDPGGELIFHPDIPDMKDYKARKWAERFVRRRKMWGRICWGWFALVLLYAAHIDPAPRMTVPEREAHRAEMAAEGRRLLWIATLPLMVRGFWHRIQTRPLA